MSGESLGYVLYSVDAGFLVGILLAIIHTAAEERRYKVMAYAICVLAGLVALHVAAWLWAA
jgi:hypothetical protein